MGLDVYGLPLDHLREVARLKRLRRIPGAPAHVAGLMNLRGQIVCALDTRAILCVPGPRPAGAGFLIALRGFPDPLGLVVDAVTDVYAVDPESIKPSTAGWPAARTAFTLGTVAIPRGLMTLLDLGPMIGMRA
jgi:purine-binding chemotaxis protein CheW